MKTEIIDAVPVLSQWYGPDSTACHSVRIIDEKNAEAQFVVGQNLCGSLARPPMFNHLVFQNGVFSIETSVEDAKEHFVDSIGIKVIPGHNIMGLVAEGLSLVYGDRRIPLYVTSFDFMRFRALTLPGQEIKFSGEVDKIDETVLATLVMSMSPQGRPFTRNFLVEAGEVVDEEIKARMLAQHWIFEANAQGLGMVALASAPKGVVPMLLEVGRSSFAKVPVLAGDTLRSHFSDISVDVQQILGDVETYVGDIQIAEIHNLLLQFVPIDKIIESAGRQ